MTVSDQASPPVSIITDPYDYIGLTLHPDGTITRKPLSFPLCSPTPDISTDRHIQVLSKDIEINQSKGTWARIYVPRDALDSSAATSTKLPLLIFFTGGRFITPVANTVLAHNFCSNIALQLSVVLVSVTYRLVPEHRLPAAYEDGVEALFCIKTMEDEWLKKHADLTKCFLMGTSAGANIIYNICLRVIAEELVNELAPLKINGLILHYPCFGGSERTESETRLANDPAYALNVADLMWELALPIGANRDHEFCDPTFGGGSKFLEKFNLLGLKVLLSGGSEDGLIDRQISLAKLMKDKGVQVESRVVEGDFHGGEALDSAKFNNLIVALRSFMFPSIVE